MDKYYSLHVHCATGSVGDSMLRIKDYVARGKEYGLDALAITDHGSLSAMYEFVDECKKYDVKPIIGMEAYTCSDNTAKDSRERGHLVLLARNNDGLRNLMSIHNNAWMQGMYYKPRTDADHLQAWGNGIIALSACVSGDIPKAILAGNMDEAVEIARFFDGIFDEFYLELQPGCFERQLIVNDGLVKIHEETGIPLVITNDVHYLNEDDYSVHDAHVKLCRSHDSDEEIRIDSEDLVYPDTCYWFMNAESIRKSVVRSDCVTDEIVEVALENAAHIAAACNVELQDSLRMPKFQVENDKTEKEVLYEMCYKNLMEVIQGKDNPQEYVDRLERELAVIDKKGFSGYFLIVQDYVNWAREQDIPVGPGRGSAAGSLVNYVLGISQPDPIKHGLMFERFLDENRAAIPDIDVDFSESATGGRDTMFQYICEKYGRDKCARVSTLGIRKSRSAIQDAARVLGMEPAESVRISKLVPQVYYGDDGEKTVDLDIATALEASEELAAEQEKNPKLFDLAMKLEGLPKTTSIHAAGILVSPDTLLDKMPLIQTKKDEDIPATSLNLDDAERQRIKFDMLGVRVLSVLHNAEKNANFRFDWRNEKLYEDEEVWKMIGSRNTDGMFQISSRLYKDRMPRLAPKTIDELAACLALVRGPCISAKADEVYMQILEGKRGIEKLDPIYDEVTAETNGILLYQEQIIKIANRYGFSMSESYDLMKMAQRKKIKALKEFRPQFVKKALQAGSSETSANKVYDTIVKAGEYSFNSSHAVSYALITFATAYMKVHYPAEFMAAYLTYAYTDAKSQKNRKEAGASVIIDDCRRMGIKFLPADCNESNWEFTAEGDKIRIGMCAIKGFGEKAARVIVDCRPLTKIQDIFDNGYGKKDFNVTAVRLGIFSGLFDCILSKPHMDAFVEYKEEQSGRKVSEDDTIKINGTSVSIETTAQEIEKTIFEAQFMTDPVNEMETIGFDKLGKGQSFKTTGILRKTKRITTKTGKKMAFLEMATADGVLDVTVFSNEYSMLKGIRNGDVYLFAARKEKEDSCILDKISRIEMEEE